jgi:hypothetical protein
MYNQVQYDIPHRNIFFETLDIRTDNTMAIKEKKTKGQTTIYKTLHRKLKIE